MVTLHLVGRLALQLTVTCIADQQYPYSRCPVWTAASYTAEHGAARRCRVMRLTEACLMRCSMFSGSQADGSSSM